MSFIVMAGLVPAIHVLFLPDKKSWTLGSSPRVTNYEKAAKPTTICVIVPIRTNRHPGLEPGSIQKPGSHAGLFSC
jgi:hypothetical protein